MANNTKQSKEMNPVAAGVVGAAIGVAGAAVASALSKKENRDKISKSIGDAGKKAEMMVKKGQKKATSVMDDVMKSAKTATGKGGTNSKKSVKKASTARSASKA